MDIATPRSPPLPFIFFSRRNAHLCLRRIPQKDYGPTPKLPFSLNFPPLSSNQFIKPLSEAWRNAFCRHPVYFLRVSRSLGIFFLMKPLLCLLTPLAPSRRDDPPATFRPLTWCIVPGFMPTFLPFATSGLLAFSKRFADSECSLTLSWSGLLKNPLFFLPAESSVAVLQREMEIHPLRRFLVKLLDLVPF